MNKLEFLPVTFYEFTCTDELVEQTLEKVKNLDYTNNQNNKRTVTDLFYDEKLYQWFDQCIDSAKADIGIPDNIKLVITSCWVNKTTKMQNHPAHNHPNSFMSGIFYFTGDHVGGNTHFYNKNVWMNDFEWIRFPNGPMPMKMQSFTPKKGTLLLFPSRISHGVGVLKDSVPRYTIAFNTFFSGPIEDSPTYLTRLSIDTKSVKDYGNET